MWGSLPKFTRCCAVSMWHLESSGASTHTERLVGSTTIRHQMVRKKKSSAPITQISVRMTRIYNNMLKLLLTCTPRDANHTSLSLTNMQTAAREGTYQTSGS